MKKKRKSLIEAERRMEQLLVKVGYTGRYKGVIVNEIPDYRVKSNLPKTSDTIPGKTPKKLENVYSGNEIMGIVVTHKSNLMPIRKDNKQAAVDASQMRRN
jgi:hypothetical protein